MHTPEAGSTTKSIAWTTQENVPSFPFQTSCWIYVTNRWAEDEEQISNTTSGDAAPPGEHELCHRRHGIAHARVHHSPFYYIFHKCRGTYTKVKPDHHLHNNNNDPILTYHSTIGTTIFTTACWRSSNRFQPKSLHRIRQRVLWGFLKIIWIRYSTENCRTDFL